MQKKYFGTDGIRGLVGKSPITPDFVLKLGWAVGTVFERAGQSKILIGKDTRISGYMLESALEAGLAAAGADVRLLGPMPTPAIAYLTRTFHAQAGIVISASHNPFFDNGIKFFSAEGKKLPDDVELAIEAQMEKPMTVVASEKLGKASRLVDARGRYIEFCKASLSNALSLQGMKIAVDCANGACYHILPDVLEELGAEVIAMGNEPDGLNINKECGSTSPEALQALVKECGADLGIAVDGDGDRLIMVDHKGEAVDGDELLFIISQDRQERGTLKGGIVGTLMSNFGLEVSLKERGIGFVRAKVGDRYVLAEMEKRGWRLGGESSGHIVCLENTTTGDAVISALQVLAAVQRTGKSLLDLKSGMSKLPQKMINVKAKASVCEEKVVLAAVGEIEKRLAGRGRVLLRPSGTEPVIRVMIEGQDAEEINALTKELADSVECAAQT